jgi:hypothetical protein
MSVRLDQAILLHPGQMLGNLGLGPIENFLEMTNAERPLRHEVQNAKTGLVAKALVNPNELHAINIGD